MSHIQTYKRKCLTYKHTKENVSHTNIHKENAKNCNSL